ncbi:hypothetical protein BsWGS_02489 [Bradybaena similaris]
MGFHADKYKPPAGQTATYYLSTGGSEPFCRYHYTVTVKFSSGSWPSVSGTAAISLGGDWGKSSWVLVTGRTATTFSSGQTYTFYVDLREDVGDVNYVYFSWQTSLLVFTLDRLPSVTVDHIEILAPEDGGRSQFCSDGQSVESGSTITLSEPC